MKQHEIENLFDDDYAAAYNKNYLLGEHFRECTEFELSLVRNLLFDARNWLDIACGTGYVLSRYPNVERAGLDLSPSMLSVARRANPGVPFYEHDFREPFDDMQARWDLVSCMWYSYCYAESIEEIRKIVSNMATWTSSRGSCFMPVCDPKAVCSINVSYPATSHGNLKITGLIWDWTDIPSGKRHLNLLAPTTELLVDMFLVFFNEVTVIPYPAFVTDCRAATRAIVAKRKRGI